MPRSLPPLSATLLALLLTLPMTARGSSSPARNAQSRELKKMGSGQQIQGDARIMHVLNRLTFGPRPGDFAAVKAMGIKRWIDQQLRPETIDDSTLQARLESYPAMQMSVRDLIQQLPPPPVIRQVIKGKFSIPLSQPEMAVYQTQVALIEMRQQAKVAKQGGQNSRAPEIASQSMHAPVADGSDADPQLAAKEKIFLPTCKPRPS
jgi:hypothetical protein